MNEADYPSCNGYHTDETYAENPDMYDGWLGACTNCPDELEGALTNIVSPIIVLTLGTQNETWRWWHEAH